MAKDTAPPKSDAISKPGFKLLKPGKSVTIGGKTYKRAKDVLIKSDKTTDVKKNIKKISYVQETLIEQYAVAADVTDERKRKERLDAYVKKHFEGDTVTDVRKALK